MELHALTQIARSYVLLVNLMLFYFLVTKINSQRIYACKVMWLLTDYKTEYIHTYTPEEAMNIELSVSGMVYPPSE